MALFHSVVTLLICLASLLRSAVNLFRSSLTGCSVCTRSSIISTIPAGFDSRLVSPNNNMLQKIAQDTDHILVMKYSGTCCQTVAKWKMCDLTDSIMKTQVYFTSHGLVDASVTVKHCEAIFVLLLGIFSLQLHNHQKH